MLRANVRLYGPVITNDRNGEVRLERDVDFAGIGDGDDVDLPPGSFRAYFDLNDPEGGSSVDVWGTLDDFRALITNIQQFITDNGG